MSRLDRNLVIATLAVLLIGACGGDDEPAGGPPKTGAKAAPKPGKVASKPGAKAESLQVYKKVEDTVPSDEAKTIRHQFHDRDFAPDPSGSENRNPFQSFVINQPGILTDQSSIPVEATEVCSKKQQVATNYGMRDLRLVGIVARGTRRFALFQDTADLGHIVTRGDCLGKEKARVKDIGAGFVTLEIVPEVVPNQPPRAAEERSIPLYPEELPITQEGGGDPSNDTASPLAPPPDLPPPEMPSDRPPGQDQ